MSAACRDGSRHISRALLWLLLAGAAAGCMVGPDFRTPVSEVPAAWVGAEGGSKAAAPVSVPVGDPCALGAWWQVFGDAVLDGLIGRAVESNLDLKQAEARIREARAARIVAQAPLFPEIDVAGQYRRGAGAAGGGGGTIPGGTTTSGSVVGGSGGGVRSFYQAGFDASWELDVFGGTRRNVEAADADLGAAIEARRNTMVTLLAEVAQNYFALRGAQKQLAVAKDNLVTQQKSVDLSEQRFHAGFVSYLDVANARAQVATTRSQIPPLEASSRQSIYNIGVLLGGAPEAMLAELSPDKSIPAVPPQVPVGLPSELLRRRPDIRQAEDQLHAAVARVGVATADLFPAFSLTGAFGWGSSMLEHVVDNASRIWSYAPAVSWPLFDAGRRAANVEIFDARAEQALLAYQQTVLNALKEVESALVAYTTEQQRRASLIEAVAANKTAVDLSTKLYSEGQTDFLNVIAAKGQLFNSEEALVISDQTIGTDLIALYKALGGGWEIGADAPVEAAAS